VNERFELKKKKKLGVLKKDECQIQVFIPLWLIGKIFGE
jgi:hypothetical protein